MKPKPGGGGIEWPVTGWPRHGPLIFAFLAVMLALLLALLLFGEKPTEDPPHTEPGVTAPTTESG